MVLSAMTQKLFQIVEIEVEGTKKLLQSSRAMDRLGSSGRRAEGGINRMTGAMDDAADAGGNAGGQFGKMFGIGMNLMFLGMAMQKIFGGLARSMLKMTGASAAFGAAVKSVLLPFFLAITPALIKFSMALIDLPKPIKMVIGFMVALIAVMGTLLFFGAQLFLLTTQITLSFTGLLFVIGAVVLTIGALALAVIMMHRAFKGIQPVISALAAIVLGTLIAVMSPLLGIAVMLAGLFAGLVGIFKKFGKVWGTIATLIVAAIGMILAPIIGLPAAIAVVVVAVVAWFWSMKDEIWGAIKKIVSFIKDLPGMIWSGLKKAGSAIKDFASKAIDYLKGLWQDGKSFVGKLVDFILDLPNKILNGLSNTASAMMELGKSIINGVVDGIEAIGDTLADTFFSFLPGPLASVVKGVSKFSGGLVNRLQNVLTPDDFILTSDGKMIEPHANDTIIGTKNPGQLGGNGNVTVNINDPVMKEDVDVQRVVDEVEDRVNRDTRGRTGLGN